MVRLNSRSSAIPVRTKDYWVRVPRDPEENAAYRQFLVAECGRSRAKRRAVLKACHDDQFFWIDSFVWQFNPKSVGTSSTERGPFVLWDYQRDAIGELNWCIRNQHDAVIEKSRDAGASWLAALVKLHPFLFGRRMVKFLLVSRNADAVDKPGDSDALFWKFDYVIRHLPEWMATVAGAGRPGILRKSMIFENPANGSMIAGQATTEKIGVGGRATAMFLDEFSQVERAREVYDRTSDTSSCRIFNGTHKGVSTCFYDLCQNSGNQYAIRKIVMHWSQHPDKRRGLYKFNPETQRVDKLDPDYEYPPDYPFVTDGSPHAGPMPGLRSPWYDHECRRKSTQRAVAADLDIAPSGTLEQVFDAAMIAQLQARHTREPDHVCELQYGLTDAVPERLYEERGGRCRLWHRLDRGLPPPAKYVFGADVATGSGATPSCLTGVDARTGAKVFEYANNRIEPKEFAYFAAAVVRLYRDEDGFEARLAWETPGPGLTFGKHIIAIGLRRVFFRYVEHRLKKVVSDTPGWVNSPDTMLLLISNYRDALRSGRFMNPSFGALSECLAFVYGKDGYVHHTGWKDSRDNSATGINHGDRVIADALAYKLIEDMNLPQNRVATVAAAEKLTFGSLAWRRQFDRLHSKKLPGWI